MKKFYSFLLLFGIKVLILALGQESSQCAPSVIGLPRGDLGYTGAYPWKRREEARLSIKLQKILTFPPGIHMGDPLLVKDQLIMGWGNQEIVIIDIQRGTIIEKIPSLHQVDNAPILYENVIWFGTRGGMLGGYHLPSKKVVWQENITPSKVLTSPTFWPPHSPSLLMVGSYAQLLIAVELETGQVVWKFPTQNYVNGSPVVNDQSLYFSSCDSHVYQLDPLKGMLLSQFKMDSYAPRHPVLYQNELACVSYRGIVYKFSGTLNLLWQYLPDPKDETNLSPSTFALATDGRFLLSLHDHYLLCLRWDTGELVWKVPTHRNPHASPVIIGPYALVDLGDEKLSLLELASGTPMWIHDLIAPILTEFAVSDQNVVVITEDRRIHLFQF